MLGAGPATPSLGNGQGVFRAFKEVHDTDLETCRANVTWMSGVHSSYPASGRNPLRIAISAHRRTVDGQGLRLHKFISLGIACKAGQDFPDYMATSYWWVSLEVQEVCLELNV